MKSFSERLNESLFLKPRGKLGRYIDSFFIFLASLGSVYIYFAVEFYLCADNQCDNLVITKYWVSLSAFYIVYGIAAFVAGVFILRSKELIYIYSLAITMIIGTGFLLFGNSFFAIAIEIGTNA